MKFTTETNKGTPNRTNVENWLSECATEYRAAGQSAQADAIEGAIRWWSKTELPSTADITATGRAMVQEFVRVRKSGQPTGTWGITPPATEAR